MKVKQAHIVVNIIQTGTVSAAFMLPKGFPHMFAFFPDMDAGAVGMEVSPDAGTTYYPLLDPDDGADAAVVANGSDPGCIDLTSWIGAIPELAPGMVLCRFTCAAQNSAAIDVHVFFKEQVSK